MKKIIASILVVFFVVLSPLSAFASTTESVMMYASMDDSNISVMSVPTGWDISVDQAIYNKNTDSFSFNSFGRVDDGASGFGNQSFYFSGNLNDYQLGYRIGYVPETQYNLTNPSSHSSANIDLSSLMLWFNLDGNNISLPFTLSSAAVPVQAYAVYDCSYDFQIFDGSVGYDRWIYENTITFTRPVDIYTSNFGQWQYLQDGSYLDNVQAGFDVSINVPMLNYDDFMNDITVRNDIADYNTYMSADTILSDSAFIEDVFTDGFRFSYDDCYIYVLYDISQTNWVPFFNSFENSTLYYGDILTYFMTINPSVFNDGKVNVNVYNVDSDNDFLFFSSISNGFSRVIGSLGSNISNIVSNATDNANRIIENTTNKINEVKQGVTEVKDSVIETKNSILDLPNKIKDMLLGLIVPSSETMSNKFSEFSELLEEKLGIIYQVPMMLFDFFDTIVNAATTPQTTLTLPAFQLPWIDGSTLTVWQPMEYRIIPEGMQVLSDLIKTITSMTVVVLTFNSVKRAYERFLRS